MMQLVFDRQAAKELRKLPAHVARRIDAALQAIAHGDTPANLDIRAMAGWAGAFRLRIGDYRAVYVLADDTMTVRVVAHRREAYR